MYQYGEHLERSAQSPGCTCHHDPSVESVTKVQRRSYEFVRALLLAVVAGCSCLPKFPISCRVRLVVQMREETKSKQIEYGSFTMHHYGTDASCGLNRPIMKQPSFGPACRRPIDFGILLLLRFPTPPIAMNCHVAGVRRSRLLERRTAAAPLHSTPSTTPAGRFARIPWLLEAAASAERVEGSPRKATCRRRGGREVVKH